MKHPVKIYKPFRDNTKNFWRCRVIVDGESYYVSAKTKTACQLLAVDKANEIRSRIVSPEMSVEALCRLWITERCVNLSPTTLLEWNRLIDKHIITSLGYYRLSELRNADCQRMITEYNKTHSAKSCSALRGVLHNMLEYAVVNELIDKNPAEHIYIAKTKQYEYYIYTTEEMLELCRVAKGTKHLLPIMLASRCGLRLSEICGLQWNDIDFKNRTLKIKQVVVNGGETGSTPIIKEVPKTATSSRPIMIPASVLELLKKQKKDSIFVFVQESGELYLPRNYGRQFADFLKRNGLPHTRFHDLRHFVATSLMDAGLSDKEIAEYMRHADTNMTRHYEHIRENRKENAPKIIDYIFASNE